MMDEIYRVSDLRQLLFCERIPWLKYHLGLPDNPTSTMKRGKQAHIDFEILEKRRRFKKYGLTLAKRKFNVWLSSFELGIQGIADMVLEAVKEGEIHLIPVELKRTRYPELTKHIEIQLIAYAMLLEKVYHQKSSTGFIYFLLQNGIKDIIITKEEKEKVQQSIKKLKEVIQAPGLAKAPSDLAVCGACEYRRYCDDIW